MKDQYLHFQWKWHNHYSLFLLECNQEMTFMGLHPLDPLADKVVSVRAQWSRVCIQYSITRKDKKMFLILYLLAVFSYFYDSVTSF